MVKRCGRQHNTHFQLPTFSCAELYIESRLSKGLWSHVDSGGMRYQQYNCESRGSGDHLHGNAHALAMHSLDHAIEMEGTKISGVKLLALWSASCNFVA